MKTRHNIWRHIYRAPLWIIPLFSLIILIYYGYQSVSYPTRVTIPLGILLIPINIILILIFLNFNFRKHPAATSILLILIGFDLYLVCDLLCCLTFPYKNTDPESLHQQITFNSNTFLHTDLIIKLLLSKLHHLLYTLSTNATLCVSLALVPYFWVLWIWRHSNAESIRNHNIKMEERDDRAQFNSIMNQILDKDPDIREYGLNRIETFIHESRNPKYYYNAIITELSSVKDNTRNVIMSSCIRRIIGLQNDYYYDFKSYSDTYIDFSKTDPDHFKDYKDNSSMNSAKKLKLLNFNIDFQKLLPYINNDYTISLNCQFINCVFTLNTEEDKKLYDTLCNMKTIVNSKAITSYN